jgi:hypothetical protein
MEETVAKTQVFCLQGCGNTSVSLLENVEVVALPTSGCFEIEMRGIEHADRPRTPKSQRQGPHAARLTFDLIWRILTSMSLYGAFGDALRRNFHSRRTEPDRWERRSYGERLKVVVPKQQ